MAVEPIKVLAELLISLFNERKRHKAALFDNHITPCYEAAKNVFDDYMNFYGELDEKLTSELSLEEILLFVKARRFEALSYREEIRATFGGIEFDDNGSTHVEAFERAVLDLVSGSQIVNHEFKHFSHSIEDFLRRPKKSENLAAFRSRLIVHARAQIEHITQCYRRIAKEYTQARTHVSER